ncbi:hypothetical protein [Pseudomonas sp. S36]|uniref:hypothetical protein n=1 Tax=Pseudomonas sp. S36 TaxID=2767447 RepID=UPI00191286B6|nr:hypothetical protein [Pseudomonas sp. S36]MBK4989816.1 hypothetical protein [Pseudomonas sp. S36]
MGSSVFDFSDDEILGSLKLYQRSLVAELLVANDEETAARIWLSSTGPLDLRKFGGVPDSGEDAFYQRFRAEFRAYVCGDERYKEERDDLLKIAKPAASYVIAAISAAVASTLGIAVGLVVPAVALLLKVVGKLGLNAWCAVGS